MPRFFFDLFDGVVTIDKEGHELPDIEAVRTEVRQTLPAMLQYEVVGRDKAHFRADVHDEHGRRVVTATIVMVIDCLDEADSPLADVTASL